MITTDDARVHASGRFAFKSPRVAEGAVDFPTERVKFRLERRPVSDGSVPRARIYSRTPGIAIGYLQDCGVMCAGPLHVRGALFDVQITRDGDGLAARFVGCGV